MKTKEELRKIIIPTRNKLSDEFVQEKSEMILNRLKNLAVFSDSKCFFTYLSFGKEVNTWPLLDFIENKRIIVPYFDEGITAGEIKNKSMDNFFQGKFGILEPKEKFDIDPNEVDLLVLPGVAFDQNGNRVGFGKGYFDRLLQHFKCPKIGLCYNFQVYGEVPVEDWDIKMDMIITEKSVYNFLKS